jgi:transcription elongation factor Elf1
MPLHGPIPEGRAFFCPHCGALYSVTHSRRSKSDSNVATCVVCQLIMDKWDSTMDKWDSTKVPIYKLIHRPEDA